MAITKVSPGLLNLDSGITITTADNTDTLTLVSTDADANVGPVLVFDRTSSSPADNDRVGSIVFQARNDAAEDTDYFTNNVQIKDASNGTEDAAVEFNIMRAGSLTSMMQFDVSETVFNDGSLDTDFRVESDGSTHMLFVDAGNNRVGINTSDPATTLEVGGVITIKGTTGSDGINFESNNQRIYHGGNRLLEGSTSTTGTISLGESYTGDALINPRIKATRGIVFGSDTATANTLDDYEEGTFDPRYSAATGGAFGASNTTYGSYTKVGQVVHISIYMYVNSIDLTGKSGVVTITGLPFTSANINPKSTGTVLTTDNTSVWGAFSDAPKTARINGDSSSINLFKLSTTTMVDLTTSDFATSGGNRNQVHFSMSYIAA